MNPTLSKIAALLLLSGVFFCLLIQQKIQHERFAGLKPILLIIYILSLIFPARILVYDFPSAQNSGVYNGTVFAGLYNLLILIMIFQKSNYKIVLRNSKSLIWMVSLFLLSCLSVFVSSNLVGSLVGIYYLLFIAVSYVVIYFKYDKNELFYSLSKALKIIVFIELALSVAYPLLGIEAAARIFYGEDALLQAFRTDRFGGMPSAVGTFGHPAPLGIFMVISSLFFIGCYLCGYRKGESSVYGASAMFVLFLTQSRTCIMTLGVVGLSLFSLKYARKSRKLFGYAIIGTTFLSLLSFFMIFETDYGRRLFLSRNFQAMQTARFIHWNLAWNIFENNIALGSGINAHLDFIRHKSQLPEVGLMYDSKSKFFENNPVHNTHLIILAEMGLFAGIIWWYGLLKSLFSHGKYILAINKTSLIYQNSPQGKVHKIALLFSFGAILSFLLYCFSGWATLHVEIISLFLIAVMLGEKWQDAIK